MAPPGPPRSWPAALARRLVTGQPLAVARHADAALRRRVAARLAEERFEVVVAEQVHAWPQCAPALARGVPVVLRAQNVESALWSEDGVVPDGLPALRAGEARRLARWEADAVRRSALTLTLCDADAERLRALAGPGARVETVSAPFPEFLATATAALDGDPAVVLFGSAWGPNLRGARWFVGEAWPRVRARLPSARLHVFGFAGRGPGVVRHPAPADSAAAFPRGARLVIPLFCASGVRLRILEAWARGVSVVSTPQGAAGLDPRGVSLAANAEQFATALAELDAPRSAALLAAGRAALRRDHDPAAVATRFEAWLKRAAGHQS